MSSDVLEIDKISSIDELASLTQATGSISKAASNNLYGINQLKAPGIVPRNRDDYGYTFFTRPQLCLTDTNLLNDRRFMSLLTTNPNTVHRYVRCMLDPRLWFNNIRTPLVDNKLAFIPILTNNLLTLSGMPDVVVPTFTTDAGLRREQWSIVDGSTDIYDTYDITCTFRNTADEPILLMMGLWTFYASMVFEGMIAPYKDFEVASEIDYNTRIYRLIMDETRTVVKKIAAVGVAFPTSVPTGNIFDYDARGAYNLANSEFSIIFKATGAMYNDDILAREFNEASAIFNPDIALRMEGKPNNLVAIPEGLKVAFNHRCYPYIDLDTLELQWLVDSTSPTFKKLLNYRKG